MQPMVVCRLPPRRACLTPHAARAHNRPVNESKSKSTVHLELEQFEQRLDELVTMVAQFKEENRALRQRLDSLMTERATLLQKNEQVRARVEAMIGRLKAMEHGA